jgi:DNA-directed RNA polymerase subunit N (RpoN/RPB10)
MRRSVKCIICGEEVKNAAKERTKHIEKHQEEYKQALASMAKYTIQSRNKNIIGKTITCGVCGITIFDNYDALINHIHKYHKEGEGLLFHFAIVEAINGGEDSGEDGEEKQNMKDYFDKA